MREISAARTLLFSALTVAAFFLLLEGGLRLVAALSGHQDDRSLPTPAERNAYQRPDPATGYALTPGYDRQGIHINALGFRGPEIARDKPAGTLRILCAGDSTTFGLGRAGCAYPAQLQAELNRLLPHRRAEVVNAGVEGYATGHVLALLQARAADLAPDLVLVLAGWNDIYSDAAVLPRALAGPRPAAGDAAGRLAAALDRLYLAKLIKRIIYLELPRLRARFIARDFGRPVEVPGFVKAAFADRLRDIAAAIRRAGARPVFLTLPAAVAPDMTARGLALVHYPDWCGGDVVRLNGVIQAFNAAIREAAAREGAALVDAAAFVAGLGPAREELFFDTMHLSCDGLAALAGFAAREIARPDVLPEAAP